MTILYSCRTDGDQFRITKFDTDLNVESSYLCTETECECPAGARPTCRHRQMLPRFIGRKMVDTNWFHDFDRGGWVQLELAQDEGVEISQDETAPIELAQTAPAPAINRRGF